MSRLILGVVFLGVIVASGCVFCTKVVFAQASSTSSYTQNLLNRQSRGTSSSYFGVDRIKSRNQSRLTPTAGVAGLNRISLPTSFSSSLSPRKPFSGVTRGPTVSPYLALSRPFGSATDYQTIVRPLREQQRQQQQQQRYNIQNQRRLNSMAAKAPFNTRGDENAAPTGHGAGFQRLGTYLNTGGYFPPPSSPKQR